MALNELDRVEILSLQDNYIESTAMDDSEIVRRARNVRDGEIRNAIQAEHGFSALVRASIDGKVRTLLLDFGFSEHGAAYNAGVLGADLKQVEAVALSGARPALSAFRRWRGATRACPRARRTVAGPPRGGTGTTARRRACPA